MAKDKIRREIGTAIINAAKNRPCLDCGNRFPSCAMDFDHRDPSTKKFTIGEGRSRNPDVIRDEISKCDVVCSNCHRIRTWKK